MDRCVAAIGMSNGGDLSHRLGDRRAADAIWDFSVAHPCP
jgi:hypothetical protein